MDRAGSTPVRVGVSDPAIGRENQKKIAVESRAVQTEAAGRESLGRVWSCAEVML